MFNFRGISALSTVSKITIGFIAGATVVGGVATAANSFTAGQVVNVCADRS
jgi:hypothetical protein